MPEMKQDRLALDRSSSVRRVDQDGHLHIERANISKANVCPYAGREIPEADRLGLDPSRTYMLLRDPDALEAAAATFNGKPLLSVHKPQSAADHDHELTIGSVNNVVWNAPYLQAELVVWDGSAIKDIESNDKRELSSGYYYQADMTPGEFDGVRYDGRMIGIVANHVAIVTEGRAGPDVFVGDSAPTTKRGHEMQLNTTKLSRPALLAGTALRTYLRPKMATDAKLDLTPIVGRVVGGKSWKSEKPKIKAALDKALTGGKLLAADADIGDVIDLLDELDDVAEEVAEATPGTTVESDDDMGNDDDVSALKALAKAKGATDEEIAAAVAGSSAMPTPAIDKDMPEAGKPPVVTKAAMDAAIAAATKIATANAETATIARLRAIQQAERDVHPFIGTITAQDSAAATYKLALDHVGIDLAGLAPEAYGPLLRALPKPGEAKPAHRAPAMDAAGTKAYAERFPNANRLAR